MKGADRAATCIAIDAHMVGTGETGNETYVRGLVGGLRRVDHRNGYLLYTTDPRRLPAELTGPRFRARRLRPAGNLPRVGVATPLAAWRDRLDLLHATYTLPPLLPCRSVVTVHDVSYRLLPRAFSPRDRLLLSLTVPLSMRRADRVITVSEASRRDILRLYGLPQTKVVAIPNGVEEHFQPVREAARLAAVRQRHGLPEHFILALGNLQPRKNLRRLVAAYALLRHQYGIRQQLVLAGRPLWREGAIYRAIERHGLVGDVVTTGYIAEADLPALYSAADIFVYPSLYEGFGLPPLEAMACGTPVIAGATSSLPEVVGEAALLVKPTDVAALAAAIARLLLDDELRRHLGAAGRARAARFSWETTARQTVAVYDAVLRG